MFTLEAYKQVKSFDIDIQNQTNVSYVTWTCFFLVSDFVLALFKKYFQYFLKVMYMFHLLKSINFLHVQILIQKFQAQCVLRSNQEYALPSYKSKLPFICMQKYMFWMSYDIKKQVTYYIYSKNIVALNAQQG